jgi:MtN3 and saliva related transmembrane protein
MVSAIIIGLIAGTLTTIAFLPQVIKAWKTRKTRDISLITFSLLVLGIFLWLVYGALIDDLPLIIFNAIAFILASTVLYFKIKHG